MMYNQIKDILESMNQKAFAPILLLVGVAIIVAIAGGAYFLNRSSKQPEKPLIGAPDHPPFNQPSPSPLPKDVLDKITVVPVNASKFERIVVAEDGCNNPVGLVVYNDKNTNSAMKINSTSLRQNEYITKGVQDLLTFLDTGKQSDFQRIDTVEGVFREYCGGAAHMLVRELPSVKYSGVDKARTVMDLATQSPVGGSIVVTVYAQKGDNLIQLSKFLGGEDLYKAHQEKCDLSKFNDDANAADRCYKQEILNDTKLQQLSLAEANNLVTRFAIK